MSSKQVGRRKRAQVCSVEQFAVLRAAQLWDCPTRKGARSAAGARGARSRRAAA